MPVPMKQLKIFDISTETTLKSHSNMKKKICYQYLNIISSDCLLEFLENFHHTRQLYICTG